MLDPGQVIKKVFDEEEESLRGLLVGTSVDPDPHSLDANQIWKRIYDPTTESIRIARVD